MYHELSLVLPPARVEALLALTSQLDCRPGPGGSRCTDFVATQRLYEPVLKDVFPGRWTRAMVVVLYPSSQLVGHQDPPIEGVRTHVPLALNPGCWNFHAGVWIQLQEGHLYEMDPTAPHGAVNWGTTIRLQLAVDEVRG